MITKAVRSVLPSQTWLLLEREEFATMVGAYFRAHAVLRSESATPAEKRQATDQVTDAILMTRFIEGQQCQLARRAIVDYGDPRDEDFWGVVVSESGFSAELLIRAVRQMHQLTGATFPAFIYRNEDEAPVSGISAEVLARVERSPERFVLFMAETDEAADEAAQDDAAQSLTYTLTVSRPSDQEGVPPDLVTFTGATRTEALDRFEAWALDIAEADDSDEREAQSFIYRAVGATFGDELAVEMFFHDASEDLDDDTHHAVPYRYEIVLFNPNQEDADRSTLERAVRAFAAYDETETPRAIRALRSELSREGQHWSVS